MCSVTAKRVGRQPGGPAFICRTGRPCAVRVNCAVPQMLEPGAIAETTVFRSARQIRSRHSQSGITGRAGRRRVHVSRRPGSAQTESRSFTLLWRADWYHSSRRGRTVAPASSAPELLGPAPVPHPASFSSPPAPRHRVPPCQSAVDEASMILISVCGCAPLVRPRHRRPLPGLPGNLLSTWRPV